MSKVSQENGKRGLIGPILTLATVVFFLVAGIYFVIAPTRESKRLEQSLIDQYGWANKYTPASNGSIPGQRVERFIRVREALQQNCRDYQGILDDVLAIESIETNEEMTPVEKTSTGIRSFTGIFSAAPNMLEFMEVRNASLLAEEMGLGEYIYIYMAVYGEQLATESVSNYSGMEEAYISQRTRDEFVQILANQLAALEAAGPGDFPEGLIVDLRAEVEAIKDGSHTSPWPNGPTGMTRESLAPYREQLADLYCAGIVKIELQQKNRGFSFE